MTEKEKLIQDRVAVEWVLSTPQGRRFVWRILSDCGIYKDYQGSNDEVFKQIGRRQIGLHLLSIISDASEDRLFEMMREAKTRSAEERIEYERANRDVVNNYIDELPGYTADGPEF